MVAVLFLFFIGVVYERWTCISLSSLIDSECPTSKINRFGCLKAFLSLFLYIGLSLATFLIGYFKVTHYDVWDSTLTHTPSVIGTFVMRVIVAPIICFLLLEFAFTYKYIDWNMFELQHMLQMGGVQWTVSAWGKYISLALADFWTLCGGRRRYKDEGFKHVYVYSYYLTFWTTITMVLLLVMTHVYTFAFPVVFSTPYFSDYNLQYRFRVITVMIIMSPIVFYLWFRNLGRPPLEDQTLRMWDDTFNNLVVERSIYNLEKEKKERVQKEKEDPIERTKALGEAARLLKDEALKYDAGFVTEMVCFNELDKH